MRWKLRIASISLILPLILSGLFFAQEEALPKNAFKRGMILFKQSRYAEAKDNFDKVIAKRPKHKRVYCYRGKCLLELDKLEDALRDFDKCLQLNPGFTLGYVNKKIKKCFCIIF